MSLFAISLQELSCCGIKVNSYLFLVSKDCLLLFCFEYVALDSTRTSLIMRVGSTNESWLFCFGATMQVSESREIRTL